MDIGGQDPDGACATIVTTGQSVQDVEEKKKMIPGLFRFAPLWMTLLLIGASVLTWYFVDCYSPSETRISQTFACSLRIRNRQLTQDLSRQDTKAFRDEASKVETMVGDLVRATKLAPLFNSSTVYAFGEGSLIAFFWVELLVEENLQREWTAKAVNLTLSQALHASANGTGAFHSKEYSIDPYSMATCGAVIEDAEDCVVACEDVEAIHKLYAKLMSRCRSKRLSGVTKK